MALQNPFLFFPFRVSSPFPFPYSARSCTKSGPLFLLFSLPTPPRLRLVPERPSKQNGEWIPRSSFEATATLGFKALFESKFGHLPYGDPCLSQVSAARFLLDSRKVEPNDIVLLKRSIGLVYREEAEGDNYFRARVRNLPISS